MIGLVLAAGAGRRLRPLTDGLPKALLPVDGAVTIFDVGVRNLAEVGITDIAVVVGFAAEAFLARRAQIEAEYGVRIEFVHNDRAQEWNNAYSLWLAREAFAGGALLINGDTLHPASVEKTLLAQRSPAASILLALDDVKRLGDEEMKVVVDPSGQLRRISKQMPPAQALGEYIGATLIEPEATAELADALETTWRRDPHGYYEDGFQCYADRGGQVRVGRIGELDWVEVDDHDDLARAREIACRC